MLGASPEKIEKCDRYSCNWSNPKINPWVKTNSYIESFEENEKNTIETILVVGKITDMKMATRTSRTSRTLIRMRIHMGFLDIIHEVSITHNQRWNRMDKSY